MASLSDVRRYFWYTTSRICPVSSFRIKALRRIDDIEIGEDCYIGPGVTITSFEYVTDETLLFLGDRVRISPNVTLLCSAVPKKTRLSEVYGRREPIRIHDDAWIGADATILPGVSIGEAALVAAGAVVCKDVPPETVVGGVPAQKISDVPFDRSSDSTLTS